MNVNTDMLKKKIRDQGMNIAGFSKSIGVNPSTFYRQIDNGGMSITVGQMHKTVEVLNLSKTDACAIFLP